MAPCAFCGPVKAELISPEDIWPHWFSRLVQRLQKPRTFHQFYWDGRRGAYEYQPAQRMNTTCDVVCRPCNNVWMSQLEDLAKDILTPLISHPDKSTVLSDEDQYTLTAWLAMKAIVLDHYAVKRQGRKPFFTPKQRQLLKEQAKIPDRVSAWIAFMPRGVKVPTGNIIPSYLYFSEPERRHLHGYVFTYSMLRIALQLLAVKDIAAPLPNAADSVPFSIRPSRGVWSDFAPSLWPLSGNVVRWPPPRKLRLFSQSAYDAFAERLTPLPD